MGSCTMPLFLSILIENFASLHQEECYSMEFQNRKVLLQANHGELVSSYLLGKLIFMCKLIKSRIEKKER